MHSHGSNASSCRNNAYVAGCPQISVSSLRHEPTCVVAAALLHVVWLIAEWVCGGSRLQQPHAHSERSVRCLLCTRRAFHLHGPIKRGVVAVLWPTDGFLFVPTVLAAFQGYCSLHMECLGCLKAFLRPSASQCCRLCLREVQCNSCRRCLSLFHCVLVLFNRTMI